YCNECNICVTSTCKKTGKDLKGCPFQESHVYKARMHIPGSQKKEISKVLKAKTLAGAQKEILEWQEFIKEHNFQLPEKVKTKPALLSFCMAKYIDFLNNVDVPEHQVKIRTKDHIDEVSRFFKYALTALNKARYNIEAITVYRIDDEAVGKIHRYVIDELNYAPRTYNKFMSCFVVFWEWLIDQKYDLINVFSKVVRKDPGESDNEIIKPAEFTKLLEVVKNGNPVAIVKYKDKGVEVSKRVNYSFE